MSEIEREAMHSPGTTEDSKKTSGPSEGQLLDADSSGDDFDDEVEDKNEDASLKKKGDFEELERLRREKRLAMNRESARARRKRKKVLLESLENRVEEMNERNQRLRLSNETLRTQVNHLETELTMARSTIALLTQDQSSSVLSGAVASAGLPTGSLGSDNLASIMQGERAALQRQSALSALSGVAGAPSGALGDEQSAMDYLHLLSLAKNREASAVQNVLTQQARDPYGLLSGENSVAISRNLSMGHLRIGGVDDVGRLSASTMPPSTNSSLSGAAVASSTSSSVEAARRAFMASLASGDLKLGDAKLDKLQQGGLGKHF